MLVYCISQDETWDQTVLLLWPQASILCEVHLLSCLPKIQILSKQPTYIRVHCRLRELQYSSNVKFLLPLNLVFKGSDILLVPQCLTADRLGIDSRVIPLCSLQSSNPSSLDRPMILELSEDCLRNTRVKKKRYTDPATKCFTKAQSHTTASGSTN